MRNQLARRQNFLDSFFNDEMFTYGKDIDIYHEDDKFVVEVDMPGFNKDDIVVEFKGDVLSINAKHDEEVEDTTRKNYYYRSRSTKSYNKQIRFNNVDNALVDAAYDDGVLKVILPTKTEEADEISRISVK